MTMTAAIAHQTMDARTLSAGRFTRGLFTERL